MLAQSSASGSGPSGAVLQVEVDRLTADNAKLTEELKALRAAWQQAHQSAQSAAMLAGTVKCSGVNKCNAGHRSARFVSVVMPSASSGACADGNACVHAAYAAPPADGMIPAAPPMGTSLHCAHAVSINQQ